MNLEDLSQFMGRIRSAATAGKMKHEFLISLNVQSFVGIIERIHLCPQQKQKDEQTAAFFLVLKLAVLPKRCVHYELECRFSQAPPTPSTCKWCWYCRKCPKGKCKSCFSCRSSGAPQRRRVVACLDAAFFKGQLPASGVLDALSHDQDLKLTMNDSHRLMLQLIAAGILDYEVVDNAAEGDKAPRLSTLFFYKKIKRRLAHSGASGDLKWQGISAVGGRDDEWCPR